jgi:hypothetical protein
MLKTLLLPALLGATAACSHAAPMTETPPACSLAAQGATALADWRAAGFDTETPDVTAADLASCLGDADPFLRDKIGYEGLTATLRAGAVSETARRTLIASLTDALSAEDAGGFHAPFAALGLAELARTDRVEAFLSEDERAALADSAAAYLASITDYRAFSDQDGWRHGVAHGADFAMQLALNPNVSVESLLHLRRSVTHQVMPASGHAYTHGESERLARPILFMASRGDIEAQDWQAWFAALVDPAPMASWGDAFSSETGLARLHNLKAFAQSLYINASLSQNPNLEPIATGALDLLRTLP